MSSSIDFEKFKEEEAAIYDTGIERAFLSCIMKEPTLINEASARIKNTDIFNKFNRTIYDTMLFLHKNQARTRTEASYDVMSMLSAAKGLGREDSFLNATGGMDHLRSIEDCPSKLSSFGQYMTTILQRSARVHAYRKARDIQIEALNASTSTRGEFVSKVEQTILSVSANREDDAIVKMGERAESFLEECKRNRGENKHGIEISFLPTLMRILNGCRRKQLIVIFARPKTGKSAFFLNLAVDVACIQKIPVLYIDTEMSQDEQLSRAIARWSGVKEWDIIKGEFTDNAASKKRVEEIAKDFADAPFYYSPARGISTEELISRCRQFKSQIVGEEEVDGVMKTKPCLIVYDWLKVGDRDAMQGLKEHQELGFISTAIKDMTAELDVPIIAGAQANRSGGGKEVDGSSAENAEHFLADSDRLLRFCTCLIWLRKLTRFEQDEVNEFGPELYYNQMLHVVDQRGGPTCMEGIPLDFHGDTLTYAEKSHIPELLHKENDEEKAGRKKIKGGTNERQRETEKDSRW